MPIKKLYVKAGSVTISADQAGNANYNAAPQVQQTFCINPAKLTITISNGIPKRLR